MAQKGLVLPAILLATAVVAARQGPGVPQSQAQQAPGTGLIVGQVVDAESGRPVGETVVTLMPASSGPVNPTAALAAAQKLIADANGRFVYYQLPKGRYSITATKPGYSNGNYGKLVPRGPGSQLELADAERATDIRILMWKHSAITGRVVDEAGEPVVGAEIRVRRVSSVAGRPGFQSTLSGQVITDDRGVYRVPGLDPGRYLIGVAATSTTIPVAMMEGFLRSAGIARGEMQQALFAASPTMSSSGSAANQVIGGHILQFENRMPTPPSSASGETRAIYAATYYPQTPRITDAMPIEVKGGETRLGVDMSIRAVPGMRVSGRLEGAGSAVGIATLYLAQASAGEPVGTVNEVTATTVSDASGAFTFLGVPAGQYVMFTMKWSLSAPPTSTQVTVVSGAGGSASRGVTTGGGGETQPAFWALQTIAVGAEDISGVSVPMKPGLRVSGRVVVEGSDPPPALQRVGVFLEASATWLRSLSFGETNLGADGSFTLPGAPAGRYVLTLPTPSGWYVKSAVAGGRDLVDLPFELKEDLTDVVVTVSNRGARVSGSVRTRDDKPDPTAGVIILPADSRQWVDFSSYARRIRDVRVGRDGMFTLSDLPAGDYYIAAIPQAQLDWATPRFFERVSQIAVRFSLAEGEQKTTDLRTGQLR